MSFNSRPWYYTWRYYILTFVAGCVALLSYNQLQTSFDLQAGITEQHDELYAEYQAAHMLPSSQSEKIEQVDSNTTIAYQKRIGSKIPWEPYAALFWESHRDLYSANKGYRLRLDNDGKLVVQRKDMHLDQPLWTTLWFVNTASEGLPQFNASNYVTLDPSGVLQLKLVQPDEKVANSTYTIESASLVWHSDMLKDCDSSKPVERLMQAPASAPSITLDNNGRVVVQNYFGQDTCTLYSGDPKSLSKQEQWGRLAITVSGLFRTLADTCSNHVEKAIKPWNGTGVDVFVYSYWEEGDVDETVREEKLNKIRSCYGTYLRDIVMDDRALAEDGFQGGEPPPMCDPKHVDRLHNQLKTLWRGASLIQNHMIRTGIQYSTIMRLRTDTLFMNGPATYKPPSEVGSKLILPQTEFKRIEKYAYCRTYQGGWTIEVSDQVMYGGVTAAMTFAGMFARFDDLVVQAQPGQAYSTFTFCPLADFPTEGHNAACRIPQPCVIECMVGYWLGLMGVEFEIDFSWDQDVLR